jgi:hypothetical protein
MRKAKHSEPDGWRRPWEVGRGEYELMVFGARNRPRSEALGGVVDPLMDLEPRLDVHELDALATRLEHAAAAHPADPGSRGEPPAIRRLAFPYRLGPAWVAWSARGATRSWRLDRNKPTVSADLH